MARLASQAKMGYYPTPESVLALIKNMIEIEGDPAQYAVFDPCCGTGEFSRAMPEGVHTYGNDLDEVRYQKAKQRVGQVLYGDALFDIKTTHSAFSCLYLNPPYDWTKDIKGESVRVEKLFLESMTKYLRRKGLLIFIIPKEALSHCAKMLSYRYKKIQVFKFPDDEYEAFKQLVVFGYRGDGKDDDMENHLHTIGNWPEWRQALPLTTLDEAASTEKFTMLPSGEIKSFKSLKINLDDLAAVVNSKGTIMEDLFQLEATDTIKTPMPLRKGHMAMLLASGYMNGEFKNLTDWYLVKGSTKKSVTVTELDNGKVETDKIEIVLKALDLNSGEFVDIK